MVDQLLKEIKNAQYHYGIVNFLKEASNDISQISTMIRNTPQNGTEKEKAFAMAKTLWQVKSLKD